MSILLLPRMVRPPERRCSIKPIEVTTSATGLSAVRRAVASCKEKCAEGGTESSKTTAAAAGDRGASRVRQLSRITIFGDDVQACQSAVSKSAILSGYDVLAIEPQSERVFGAACTSLDVDVISLDLTKRLPYRLKSTAVKAALARGVFFEVRCWWAQAMTSYGFQLSMSRISSLLHAGLLCTSAERSRRTATILLKRAIAESRDAREQFGP